MWCQQPEWYTPRVAAGETISLTLTAIFGAVSSVGVVYQVIEIRQRSRRSSPAMGQNVVAPAVPTPAVGRMDTPLWTPPIEPRQAYVRPEDATVRLGVPPPGPAPAVYPVAQPYPAPPAWQPPPMPTPVAPPAYPYHVIATGPPIAPRAVSRVRVLFLVLTVLLVPGVILMSYAISVDPSPSTTGTRYSFVEYTISYLVLSIPLEVLLVVLSRLVGRGRNGARVTALVVLLSLGLFCSCFGFLAPIAEFDPSKTGLTLTYVFLGLSWFAFGAIAVVVSVMLLQPQSNRYFREMTQWLASTRRRRVATG
jgi:hypothetical protein